MKTPEHFLRIIQISDTHLLADENKALLGVPANQSFKAVVALMQAEPAIDAILHTGDMSQDNTPESYEYFAQYMQPLAKPIYYVPGNHDEQVIQTASLRRNSIVEHKQIIFDHWQVILLNSQKTDCIEGYLSRQELAFLKQCLSAHPNHYALIALHHHPVPTGRVRTDAHSLENAEAFWELLGQFPRAKGVISGHIHQDFSQEVNGIQYYACPSTWVQFNRQTKHFSLKSEPQGYRWLNLYDDGKIETGVTRLANYLGEFIEKPPPY